jgi:SAM-dependent methyltransferase
MNAQVKFDEEYFRKRHGRTVPFFSAASQYFFRSRLRYRFWDRCLGKKKGYGRLLDIGCAEGYLLRYATERGYSAIGVDISEWAVRFAKKRIGCATMAADARHLPFADDSFDFVTCFDVMEHLAHPKHAFDEVSRVTRKNGRFVISVPNTGSWGRMAKEDQWFGYRDLTHVSLLSRDQWTKLLLDAGFGINTWFTDVLWDPPYYKGIPRVLQQVAFKPRLPMFFLGVLKSSKECDGENLYFVCQKL